MGWTPDKTRRGLIRFLGFSAAAVSAVASLMVREEVRNAMEPDRETKALVLLGIIVHRIIMAAKSDVVLRGTMLLKYR